MCQKFEKHRCASCKSDPAIVLRQKKSEFRLNNPGRKKICVVEIDNCYIKNSARKCDYAVMVCDLRIAYLVELKGCNVFHGIEQISSTINLIGADFAGYAINARIVTTRISVPNLRNSPKHLQFQRMLRKYGGTCDHRNGVLMENV